MDVYLLLYHRAVVRKEHTAVAYVPQVAWIRTASVRDNVLFGSPYHASRYNKVLAACCLHDDLDAMPYRE